MSNEITKERLMLRIAELEQLLKPVPKKPRKTKIRKGLPNGKVMFRFQF